MNIMYIHNHIQPHEQIRCVDTSQLYMITIGITKSKQRVPDASKRLHIMH